MRISGLSRHASSCVAAAMLAGCGGHASNGAVPINGNPDSAPSQPTFHYTGGEQHFTVPLRVTHITVVARGAKGAGYRGQMADRLLGLSECLSDITQEIRTAGESVSLFQ
jgi:hypothetical protein